MRLSHFSRSLDPSPDLSFDRSEPESSKLGNDSTFSREIYEKGEDAWFGDMGQIYEPKMEKVLEDCQPYPGDTDRWLNKPLAHPYRSKHFEVTKGRFGSKFLTESGA